LVDFLRFYEETDKKADQMTYKMITKLLQEHEGELHTEEIDYITHFTFSESYFYRLPKVHISEVISNAILEQHTECINILNPDDLTFRPIVGEPNCVTQRLSHCIDIIYKPLCCEVPSFIRDVLEVLSHLPTTVNPNSELISHYVISLYSNIPHDLGISAITFWLENKRNIGQQHFFKEFILETVKIILDRNVFYFVITLIDGKFYQQKRRTQWELKWHQLTLLLFLDTLNTYYTNNF
jgi:hypothetical protein